MCWDRLIESEQQAPKQQPQRRPAPQPISNSLSPKTVTVPAHEPEPAAIPAGS